MNDAYEIIVRAVGRSDFISESTKHLAEAMLEWRMSDHDGTLPSFEERQHLQAGIQETFRNRYHANPYRVSIAVIATTPKNRPPADWRMYRYGIQEENDVKEI